MQLVLSVTDDLSGICYNITNKHVKHYNKINPTLKKATSWQHIWLTVRVFYRSSWYNEHIERLSRQDL